MNLLNTFVMISGIMIIIFIGIWTVIRWQKIINHKNENWYGKAFWISLSTALVFICITSIIYFAHLY